MEIDCAKVCSRNTKRRVAGSLVLLLLATQGCAVFPTGKKTIWGNQITRSDLAAIKVGVTTREEIVQRHGPPDEIIDELRVIVYQWTAYRPWGWIFASPYGGKDGAFTAEDIFVGLIAFNSEDRVARIKTKQIDRHTTLRAAAYLFGKAKIPTNFFVRSIPSGQALLYVYVPSDASVFARGMICLDGKLLAELDKGTFTWSVVPPGTHTIDVPALREPGSEQIPPIVTLADHAYYVEFNVQHPSLFHVKPTFTLRTETEALPQIQNLTARW